MVIVGPKPALGKRLIISEGLAAGLPGDVEPVGEGVSELRIHYGPGYRIYFQTRGNLLIVLLCGGDKSTRSRNIAPAKKLAKEWSDQND